ncbi:membrane bound O-acyl transferase, MBOAT, partial [Kipferlia bialata]
YWNAGTSYWLATYIYKRSFNWMKSKGIKAGPAKTLAVLITDVVSALWHGPYPPFLVFFVWCALLTFANRAVATVFQAMLYAMSQSASKATVKWGKVLYKVYYVCGVICVHTGLAHMASMFSYGDVKVWVRTLKFLHYYPVWQLLAAVPLVMLGKLKPVRKMIVTHKAYLKEEREAKKALKAKAQAEAKAEAEAAPDAKESVSSETKAKAE